MRRRCSSRAKVSGLGPVVELADDFELRHVEDVDHIVVAAGDVELGVVGVEMHVARAARRLDVLDHLVGLGIEHDDVVRLLVADEDQAGVLGLRWASMPREAEEPEPTANRRTATAVTLRLAESPRIAARVRPSQRSRASQG